MRTHSRIVIGHHLILHGYGHWLPNDPRGSGSEELRQDKLAGLGPIHLGRKKSQPRAVSCASSGALLRRCSIFR